MQWGCCYPTLDATENDNLQMYTNRCTQTYDMEFQFLGSNWNTNLEQWGWTLFIYMN